MKVKTYKNTNLVLGLLAILSGVYSFYTGSALVAFLGVALYMVLSSLLRTAVDGVLTDERQTIVAEKAAQTSFRVFLPIFILTTIGLLVGAGSYQFLYIKGLGIVMAYITVLCIAIYGITYWYFDRKMGGS